MSIYQVSSGQIT